MPIRTGGILRAALLTGFVLVAAPAVAQTNPGGGWTDPPARGAAPAAAPVVAEPAPVAAAPVAKAGEPSVPDRKGPVAKAAESRPVTAEPSAARRIAAVRGTKRNRAVEPVRSRAVAEVPRTRPRIVERRAVNRPPHRFAARPVAPRFVEPRTYAYGPMPVGRVERRPYGERRPVFADGDDRTRRIAAAQAAGYLVVRSRSVEFPDGRTLRTYRPYDGDDDLD